MRFSQLMLGIIAATASVECQSISAEKTVSNINGITSMSKNLNTLSKTVTLLNGFQTGPEVIQGFHMIVKTATKDYNEMNGNSKKRNSEHNYVGSPSAHALQAREKSSYTHAEQEKVCSAFIDFVKVHQALLSTIIGKHGILEVTGVAYQMAAVLRGVEGVVDEIAFTLIGEVPGCAAQAKEQKKNLDKSLSKTIDTYASGLP